MTFDDFVERQSEDLEKEIPYILKKRITCPICDTQFPGLTVKTGKVRRVGTDMDLRPLNSPLDSLKYGVYRCPKCGYSAMAKSFDKLTGVQRKFIKEQVCEQYVKRSDGLDDMLSYDEAIDMHKLALVCTMAKRGRDSESGYLCLLLSWLYKGKAQMVEKYQEEIGGDPDRDIMDMIADAKSECDKFAQRARESLIQAEAKETPPFCGLDIPTLEYIVAALAYETGKTELAMKVCSTVMTNKATSAQLKDRAYDLKEMIKAAKEKEGGGQ